MPEILRREIHLACPPKHAFVVFIEQVDLWWPRSHRRNREAQLYFDGDMLVERAPGTASWTMARITERTDPARLRLDWFPGSPDAPTDVEITFAAAAHGTTITIVHRPLSEAAARAWPNRVATFTNGWDAVLRALAEAVANEST
ncbi:MAG: hypothetical protein JWN11_1801 [Hyphomicrobiales bacterium]|nr:hypothetical protein [Hyphomicrobiales bacterium]